MADTKTSDESAASALTGAELVRIVQSAANAKVTAAEIAALRVLFSLVMSSPPTEAGTGMTTHAFETGVTVADRLSGVQLTVPSAGSADKWSILSKAAPSTPYSIKALFSVTGLSTSDVNVGLGWYDGTKLHVIRAFKNTAGFSIIVTRYSNRTTFNSNADFAGAVGQISETVWLRIRHDGTNIYFEYSASGDDDDFQTVFSTTPAAGYLAGSYSNVFWGGAANGVTAKFMMLSFKQGT